MNYVQVAQATRCHVGNRFFLQAQAQQIEVHRHTRSLNSAYEHSRFRFIPINRTRLENAKAEVRSFVRLFEEHLSECDRCAPMNKVLETI